jgi:integrase
MSWVEKLPSGRYRARYRGDDGTRHSQIFTTKTAAKSFLSEVGADIARGQWIDPRGGQMLFADWERAWSMARVVRESTKVTDEGRIRTHLLPEFGERRLKDITPISVRSWVARLCQYRAPKTVRHCHALLSTMLGDAITEGLLLTNPCRGTRMPAPSASIARFLTPAEIEALVAATPEHYRPVVVVAVSTGLRWGELAGLRPEYVDVSRRQLRVVETLSEVRGTMTMGPPKTPRSARRVSLPAQAIDALTTAMAVRDQEYVFVTETGFPMRRHNFGRRVFKPALVRAGIDSRTRFHDLRHTHVALLIAAGVPVKAVQERLGHTSIVTTMDRYGHLLESVDEAVLAGLEQQLPNLGSSSPHPAAAD